MPRGGEWPEPNQQCFVPFQKQMRAAKERVEGEKEKEKVVN